MQVICVLELLVNKRDVRGLGGSRWITEIVAFPHGNIELISGLKDGTDQELEFV